MKRSGTFMFGVCDEGGVLGMSSRSQAQLVPLQMEHMPTALRGGVCNEGGALGVDGKVASGTASGWEGLPDCAPPPIN